MIPTPDQMHHDDPESLTLRDLNLTKRPYTVLARNKVTVSELLTMTREDLLAYRGLGEGSVNAIAVSLKRHGLSLRTSPPSTEQPQRATERGSQLRDRWLAGETMAQIAFSEGLSPEKARQFILQADHDAPTKRRILQAAARGKITAEEVKQLFERLNPNAERYREEHPDAT